MSTQQVSPNLNSSSENINHHEATAVHSFFPGADCPLLLRRSRQRGRQQGCQEARQEGSLRPWVRRRSWLRRRLVRRRTRGRIRRRTRQDCDPDQGGSLLRPQTLPRHGGEESSLSSTPPRSLPRGQTLPRPRAQALPSPRRQAIPRHGRETSPLPSPRSRQSSGGSTLPSDRSQALPSGGAKACCGTSPSPCDHPQASADLCPRRRTRRIWRSRILRFWRTPRIRRSPLKLNN